VTDSQRPNTPSLEMAHVLFMDIVAYSALHMDRQQQLLHDLQEAVRNTSAFNRAQAEDQLIRLPTGDGMALVFFRDPEAPVRCAIGATFSKAIFGSVAMFKRPPAWRHRVATQSSRASLLASTYSSFLMNPKPLTQQSF
jgi:hypothetical protein